ncbi:MAG: 30S ribosomal protein S2 [Candidatus Portnoybacteria bacterium RBG_19FT_COMBO_36_7]|uniref:Small ribosomal subunit protein uS2 n=1 Tax=Candidatus Portnoybacteria bacterium RBG_19FT_COMBO_36_7 TaxID=1801992 RepID=A0A1G2F7P8_9BACT|nr:MAG: 30S ribosomal protein S2 [Candidatus Portnoybacteria bacterium RBG_19FT_COMBO_36_7]
MAEEKNESAQIEKKIEVRLPTAEQLVEAGVHFGHKTSRWNPKMASYIFGAKNAVHILDIDKTLLMLKEAAEFAAAIAAKGGLLIFVGTKPPAKKIIKEAAEVCGMPFVNLRWLGGTLTNFKTIGKRLEYFRDLERKMAEGELKKYTKKEQLGFSRQLEEMGNIFGGIKNLTKLPEAIFVTDLKENLLAVKEAKKSKIKVIAIADTNADPKMADFLIPANDNAASSVRIIVDTIADAIKEGKK